MLKGIARTLGLGVGAIVLALASLPAGAAAGAGASVAPLRPSPSAAPVAARPNIVLIMTDDQNLDDLRWMPLTRRLIGAAGVRFENGISPNPLCCPARASLLTGQMSQNNGVWNNIGKHGGYQALNRGTTLPVWLRNAGYQTAFFGKHLNDTILGSTVAIPGGPSWTPR
jgi:arylsulfatase A-like enzyme